MSWLRRGALAGVLVLVSAVPAAAVGYGLDPTAYPVREPISSRVVDDWKLAGPALASGVQIAPRWVLTTAHAPGRVGGTFTNAYGTATIDAVTSCAESTCDLSLSHLAAALPAPAFPDLVDGGLPDDNSFGGHVLAVGMGGGPLTAGWTTVTGAPRLFSLGTPPSAISGDSGGPAFYHRPGDTTGHLVGLMTAAALGVMPGVYDFSPAARAFIDTTTGGAVRWTTAAQLGPWPTLPLAVTDFTATATATSITLRWNPVVTDPPVTRYTAVLVNPDNPQGRWSQQTTGTSATFTTSPGPWAAYVLPENANGQAVMPATMSAAWPVVTIHHPRFVSAGTVPGPVDMVQGSATPTGVRVSWARDHNAAAGVNRSEVRLCGGTAPTCASPLLTKWTETNTADFEWPPNLGYGAPYTVSVRDTNLAGVGPEVVANGNYLPLLPPTAPRQVTARVTDKAIEVTFDPSGDDAATLGVPLETYRQHAAPDIHLVYTTDPNGVRQFLTATKQATFRFPVAGRFSPGRHLITLTPRSSMWGEGLSITIPVVVGTPGTTTRVSARPPQPVLTGTTPLRWTQPHPTDDQVPATSFLAVDRATGRVVELGASTRELAQPGRWSLIAAHRDYGQSLPVG
ncbi:hypothetical protein [Actinokineospora cianjurensis]|uniref:Fibronectin type-III domain-containing protein n=1 Tax=Actinokineospora cianjurensis TaxID=585224 RepID=A0A421B0Z7_9PSEU|nr:hypothetical protein [Actinokineospora cianjurensis]RLK58054.1 hypothetical protein CLV68_4147 [Actinokineospora cianjurensis]